MPILAHANCKKVTSTSSLTSELIAAGYTAGSWTGGCDTCGGSTTISNVVSISSSSTLMPSGTLLASATEEMLTSGRSGGYSSQQILYRCALTDAGSLFEMYSLRAYSPGDYTGYLVTDEIEEGYYSYVKNVAFRLTNVSTGEYYSRYWKSREFTSDDWVQDDNYIYIPASAFSNVKVELFKIDSESHYSNSSTRYVYSYIYPIGRLAFKGPGLSTANLNAGDDSRTVILGYYANWPAVWQLTGVTFVRGYTCTIIDYPSVVILPKISAASLNNGEYSQNDFSVSLSCEDSAISSVSTSSSSSANVAMGFLVNHAEAVSAATSLGLTSTNGLTYLLDTNYGSSGVASGVGIRIYDENGNALNLLSSNTSATGNSGGWYAYKDLTTSQEDSTDGLTTYTGNFTASLEAISGETVTAGSVNAQLQVVVSFQ